MELTPISKKPLAFGAAYEPTKIQAALPKPADFDAFWSRKLSELRKIPANPQLTPATSPDPSVDYSTIQMDHVNGTHVHGNLVKPKGTGKHPALLMLHWASPPYPLDPWWIIGYARQGFIALGIEPHNVLPTQPKSYYDSLPAALKSYQSIGQDDREKSYFVEMYLRGVRAVDYLASRPDWDGKTIVVIGTSMGGQQGFCVSGLHPKVTHLIVNVPAGSDLNGARAGRQVGYPFFPNDPKVLSAARYVDASNFASRIRARSMVALGFVDTVTPPTGIWATFNAIRAPKEAVPMPESPHNHVATPEQQRPWTKRSAEWLEAIAKGKPVP